jgi:tRNA pseudouridine55 synthase
VIINVYKPKSWTSFDVVAKVRNLARIKKVGHAGTLDPLAEGVLIVLTEQDTKKQDSFKDLTKEYAFDFIAGVTTPSADLETIPEFISQPNPQDLDKKSALLTQKYMGDITQTAPIYSAKKVNGKRLYAVARSHNAEAKLDQLTLPTFTVHIYELKYLGYVIKKIATSSGVKDLPVLSWTVKCSPGTYIRTLAQDLAKEMNTDAVVSRLVRTAIGDYKIEDSKKLEELRFF